MNFTVRVRRLVWTVAVAGMLLPSARADLIGFYPFDSNEPLADASGGGNTLTSADADPVHEPEGGLSGGAYRFNGAQRLVVPIDINPTTYGHLTMGAWVRTTSLEPGLRKIMGHDDGGWDRTIGLDNREGPFRYTSFTGSGPGPDTLPGPTSTEDWTLIVAVYDDLTPELTVYVDVNANTVGDDLVSATVPDAFFGLGHITASIGNLRPDTDDEGWVGYIDNAFFFDQLLTAEEVRQIRNNGTPRLEVEADPNFSAISIPDLSALQKTPATHEIAIPIRNDGAAQALNITSATVSGPDAAFYTVSSFPNQLASGADGMINVTFDPRGEVGVFHAVLTVVSDDSVQPRTTLDISATVMPDGATDPALTVVTPDPIFGERGLGTSTASIEIRNSGAAQTLNISSATIIGPDASHYAVTAFPETLAPGASGMVMVTFDPMGEAKTFGAQLSLTSNNATDRTTLIDLSAIVRSQNIREALIGFYPFDDVNNPMRDESGNGNDLTEPTDLFVPAHDPEGGFEGGGYLFTGGERLVVPININPTVLPEMTMGAWVRTDLLDSGLRKVMGHDNGGWDRTIGLDNRNADGTEGPFRYTAFTGTSPGPTELPGPVNTEDWTFVAASYNQTLGEMVVYVDIDASTTDDPLESAAVAATFGAGFATASIGNLRPDTGAEGWVGSIDNAFFYSASLTTEQVTQIRNGGREFILEGGGMPTAPQITSITVDGPVEIVWTSVAGATYAVEYTEALPGPWSAIGTQASQGATTSFQDNDATRRARPTGFYRVAVQP